MVGTERTTSRRLDEVLVERGIADTRDRAGALVAAGLIEVAGRVATSSALRIATDAEIRVVGRDHPWASRGGVKLDAALAEWGISCEGRVALDAGASTGGFVSVLLARGVRLVYAVDVGNGQLRSDLANDERVVVMDRTNVRTLTTISGEAPDLVTLDLSFISLRSVMPALAALAPGAEVVALFKPQFELGRDSVGPGGIVSDPDAGRAGAEAFLVWLGDERLGDALAAPLPSALRGTKGNQEFLVHARLSGGA